MYTSVVAQIWIFFSFLDVSFAQNIRLFAQLYLHNYTLIFATIMCLHPK